MSKKKLAASAEEADACLGISAGGALLLSVEAGQKARLLAALEAASAAYGATGLGALLVTWLEGLIPTGDGDE